MAALIDLHARAFGRGSDARINGHALGCLCGCNPYDSGTQPRLSNAFRAGWLDVNGAWATWLKGRFGPPLRRVREAEELVEVE